MRRAPALMDLQQPFHDRADMFLQLTMAHFQNIESGISFPNSDIEGEENDRAMDRFGTEGWNEMNWKVPNGTTRFTAITHT
jgi:hypothetical protein